MKSSISFVAGMLIVLSSLSLQSASGGIIVGGVNAFMAGKPAGSNLNIPLNTDSGEYGVGAGGTAGLTANSVQLGSGQSASGSLGLNETFGVSPLDPAQPTLLTFHVTDLDFLTQNISNVANYRESIDVGIIFNPGMPARQLVTIDNTNYMLFRTSGGTATNETAADYAIDLRNYIGTTAWDTINSHFGFQVEVTFHSSLDRVGGGTYTFGNPAEGFSNSFAYSAVPEPATMALLLAGVPLMLRRKRNVR